MEDYHWNPEDEYTRQRGSEAPRLPGRREIGGDQKLEELINATAEACCEEDSKVHMSNSEFFELLKMPELDELEQKVDEFWVNYEPKEFHSPSNFELRASTSLLRERQERQLKGIQENIRLVQGPTSQHVQVPEWVYQARTNPKLFEVILDYYFKAMHWPDLRELPYWFRRKCAVRKISADNFRLTAGFAPVWVFLLKELCDAQSIEREWMRMCMDQFFENGRFPEFRQMPNELDDICQRVNVGENHFYEVIHC